MSSRIVASTWPEAREYIGRSAALDAFRGLAIVLMMVDHATLLSGGPHIIRLTVGRLAMPMFFVLAGHLARRITWRHGGVLAVGVALPLIVPWVDNPNVLVWWVVGSVLLAVTRWAELSPVWLVLIALTCTANGYLDMPGTSYDSRSLVALMAVGALLPRGWFLGITVLPEWLGVPLAFIGRAPLRWYVGHVLAFSLLWAVMS